MRGEHSRVRLPLTTTLGSSPHARGALVAPDVGDDRLGIIPACAGSTCLHNRQATHIGDHPRMRGEHWS